MLLALSLIGFVWSSSVPSVAGAYIAFASSLLIWGWHEMTFLMGYITGPRRTACPSGSSGWRRFFFAAQTVIYHELALFATAALLIAAVWDATNQVGACAFVILWLMRLSTKLNIFLGASNLAEEFLPNQLRYLESYFKRAPMNFLFPLSVTLSTVVLAVLAQQAIAQGASAFEVAGYSLLATLLALGILEHWFLVVPLPATALWRWGLRSHSKLIAFENEQDDRKETSGRSPDRRLLAKTEPLSVPCSNSATSPARAAAIRA